MEELINSMMDELSEKWKLDKEKTIEKSIVFSDIFMSELFKTEIKAQNTKKADKYIAFFSDLWNLSEEDTILSIVSMFSKLYNAFENKDDPTSFYKKIYEEKND